MNFETVLDMNSQNEWIVYGRLQI